MEGARAEGAKIEGRREQEQRGRGSRNRVMEGAGAEGAETGTQDGSQRAVRMDEKMLRTEQRELKIDPGC